MNIKNKTIAVKIMTTLKVKNLDEVYSTLKSLAGELSVAGWAVTDTDYVFNSCNGTLLQWFFENIKVLKTGVKDLLVANGVCTENNSYATWEDTLTVTTTPTNSGLLVEVVRTSNSYDNPGGWGRYSGGYELSTEEFSNTFLLEYEEK
jgi:hypothetical protein